MTQAGLVFPEQYRGELTPLSHWFPTVFQGGSDQPTATIGIGALTHDTSAALVRDEDGSVLYAVSEERLSNVKHDSRFPSGALWRCCEAAQQAGLRVAGVGVNFKYQEFVSVTLRNQLAGAFSEAECAVMVGIAEEVLEEAKDPFDRTGGSDTRARMLALIRDSSVGRALAPERLAEFELRASWYFNAAYKYRCIGDIVARLFPGVPVAFFNHHDAHAASAYFGIGEGDAAVLVVDGHGESDTTSIFKAGAGKLRSVVRTEWPHSLGSLYLSATRHLGFDYGDEYKVMGMAAYGQPKHLDALRTVAKVDDTGRLRLIEGPLLCRANVRDSGHSRFQFTDRVDALVARRDGKTALEQTHFDFAASIQALTEELGVQLADRATQLTGCRRLAIAGGVGLNGLMNTAIRRSGVCDDLFIYPAASDDGTSVGAAQAMLLDRGVGPSRRVRSCYFGHRAADHEMRAALDERGIRYSRPDDIHLAIARALKDGLIVGRYVGGAEFGPRALGNRSILANPSDAGMKDTLNLRVKHREEFRPFAPACLVERVEEFFEINGEAPFMLLIVRAKEAARRMCPAVVHADGTARVQTVSTEHNPDFAATISSFAALTGVPVVINTSFNVNGETIVDSPDDAIESFGFMDIDCLAIGDYWVLKRDNRDRFPDYSHAEYLELRRERYRQRDRLSLGSVDVRGYGPWFFSGALKS